MSTTPATPGAPAEHLADAAHHVLSAVEQLGVVPVVEIEDPAHAVPLARALAEAGLPVLEVTFRTPAAREALALIAERVPEVLLGAGTLLDAAAVRAAADAGARFAVSPGFSAATAAAAAAAGLPLVPGAVTPSEVMACWQAGVRHVKFFPAQAYGGTGTVAALAGPFGWTGLRFMPTGGVSPVNAAEYLAMPSVFAVGGTWIAPRDDIAAGRWQEIGRRARAVADLRPAREGGTA